MEPLGAICILLVNDVSPMSGIAVRSILAHSNATIYVGYSRKSDLLDLPNDSRLVFINLNEISADFSNMPKIDPYSDYSTEEFYKIVKFKWVLFRQIFEITELAFLLYVDLDVLWFSDILDYTEKSFARFKSKDIIIQDASDKLFEPALCMGVFAMRRSHFTFSLIEDCAKLHEERLIENSRIGDDSIITEYFEMRSNSEKFLLFPQKTFPVGNMVSTFKNFSIFPGLQSPKPLLFHANYVVGIRKKVLLMFLIGKQLNEVEMFQFSRLKILFLSFELLLRRSKFFMSRLISNSNITIGGDK